MNKKEIAKEFTRQMPGQNTHNELRTGNKHAQANRAKHKEVLNNMDSYRTKHRTPNFSFTDHHSQLNLSEQQ